MKLRALRVVNDGRVGRAEALDVGAPILRSLYHH